MPEDKENGGTRTPSEVVPNKPLIIVGVGSSAGGLEALQIMISNLPDDTNMSFIVAQHLSPSHKSMMVDLLLKDAPIPVFTAVDGEALRGNTLYICPPQSQYRNVSRQQNCTDQLYRGPTHSAAVNRHAV